MSIRVRPLASDDLAGWRPLWDGYLAFYRKDLPEAVTAETWRRLHDPTIPLHALGATLDGRLVGFTTYLFHHSTWAVGPYCYLEDLFTAEEARGLGAGHAMIAAVADAARTAGAERLYWQTQVDNHTARRLYDRVARNSGMICYAKDL